MDGGRFAVPADGVGGELLPEGLPLFAVFGESVAVARRFQRLGQSSGRQRRSDGVRERLASLAAKITAGQ